jgi:hypothetical protein
MKARRPSTVVSHLFSRGVLGSMLVGTATGKVVEKVVILAFGSTWARLVGWTFATLVFVTLYVYWADFSDAVQEAADGAADAVEGDDG